MLCLVQIVQHDRLSSTVVWSSYGDFASSDILEANDREFGKRRAAAATSLTPELDGIVYAHVAGVLNATQAERAGQQLVLTDQIWCCYWGLRVAHYPLSYGVPVRERYGSTLLPATREQHDQNCTQSH